MDATSDSTCLVCGDISTGQRYYGATSVCYSCRIFFRRVVASKQTFNCIGHNNCQVDKQTRNNCKSCRYDKCISSGMLPCLVNSVNRKPYTKVTSNDKKELALVPSKIQNVPVQIILSANPIEKPLTIDFFEKEYVQGRMIQILEDIWEDGMEKTTFEHTTHCVNGLKEKKPVIYLPPEYFETIHQYQSKLTQQFIKCFLPQISQQNLTKLECSLNMALYGMQHALAQSFESKNLLEQMTGKAFNNSQKIINWLIENFPETEEMEPVEMERFDAMKSPFMKNAEDEQFITDTVEKVKYIIDGDRNIAQLFQLLVFFSPVEVDLADKNIQIMKMFQDKISIMLYTYLLKRSSNLKTLDKMTKLVSLIDDCHKVGKLFSSGFLKTMDAIEIDDIQIDSLS